MNQKFGRAASFQSALLVTGATYVSYFVGLIVSMIVARSLGPRDYGHYAYLIWMAGILTTLYFNGLTLSAIRFISELLGAEDTDKAKAVHHLLSRWFAISILLVSIAFAVVYPWLAPAGWENSTLIFAAAAMFAAIAKSDYTFQTSVSKGYGHFEVDAYTINTMSAFNLFGVLFLACVPAPLMAYIFFFVILGLGHAVVSRHLVRRAGIVSARGPLDQELLGRIKQHFLWTSALFLVFSFSNKSVENLFLNAYVGPEAVGWFAIGAAMTRGGVDLLSSGLSTVLLPILSHAFGSNDVDRAKRILIDAMRYYFFLGLALAGVGVLWAAPVITLLYGAQYAPAIIGLQVMVLVGALTMSDGATYTLLMTTDRQYIRVALAVMIVVLTLLAAALLVPSYGFKGALAAHALARTAIYFVSMGIIVRIFRIALPFSEFARMAAAAAIGVAAAALVLLVSDELWGQFVAGFFYGLGCLGGSLLLRVWSIRDVKLLADLAERLPPLRGLAAWLERHARKA